MVKSLKKQINFFDEFKEWYYKIITDFKFNIICLIYYSKQNYDIIEYVNIKNEEEDEKDGL